MTGRHFRPEDESELDREEVLRQLREILAHGDNEATYRESKLPNAVLRAQIALLKGLRPDQTAEYTAKPGKALRVAAFALAGGVAITVVLAVAAEKALPSWLLDQSVKLAAPFVRGVLDGLEDTSTELGDVYIVMERLMVPASAEDQPARPPVEVTPPAPAAADGATDIGPFIVVSGDSQSLGLGVGNGGPVALGAEIGLDPLPAVTRVLYGYQGKHAKPLATVSVSLLGASPVVIEF